MNHYETLNVSPLATQEEIKARYRLIAQRTHPDRNGGKEHLTRIFKAAKAAYEILGDPASRQEYDANMLNMFVSDPAAKSQEIARNFIITTLEGEIT